ncbi:hypothetical protein HOG98_00185 [bacterium]|jgi:hypothetical protein|nr:hypothetical protein [bacterium]
MVESLITHSVNIRELVLKEKKLSLVRTEKDAVNFASRDKLFLGLKKIKELLGTTYRSLLVTNKGITKEFESKYYVLSINLKGLQLNEKSDVGISKYQYSFNTNKMRLNGKDVTKEFVYDLLAKIGKVVTEIREQTVKIYAKKLGDK